jgi:hypothetical protein
MSPNPLKKRRRARPSEFALPPLILLFAGCATGPEWVPLVREDLVLLPEDQCRLRSIVGPQTEPAAPIAGENILHAPQVVSYPLNRYTDPQDPRLMHEAHIVHRIETGAQWRLAPRVSTAGLEDGRRSLDPSGTRQAP